MNLLEWFLKDWGHDQVPNTVEESLQGCRPGEWTNAPIDLARVMTLQNDLIERGKRTWFTCQKRPFIDVSDAEIDAYEQAGRGRSDPSIAKTGRAAISASSGRGRNADADAIINDQLSMTNSMGNGGNEPMGTSRKNRRVQSHPVLQESRSRGRPTDGSA